MNENEQQPNAAVESTGLVDAIRNVIATVDRLRMETRGPGLHYVHMPLVEARRQLNNALIQADRPVSTDEVSQSSV